MVGTSHRAGTLCGRIQILQHLVHHGDFGIVVPSWIILICCNVYALDHTVLDEHGKPLAPRVSKNRHRSWMVQHHTKSLCELATRITQEFDDGTIDRLIICPTLHDSTIVDTVNEHIRDALGLQLFLLFQVSRNLLRGSAGCESSRKPNQNHCLVLAVIS